MSKRDPLPSSVIRSYDRMKDRTGTYLLAGCASDAVSYEASRYGQGLLTYSLLFNMRGAALRDGEYVDVRTLFEHAADQVPVLAAGIGGVQRPQIAAPPVDRGSFDIGRLPTAADRERIPLKSVRPMFMRSNFQEERAYDDILGLAVKLDNAMREISAEGMAAPYLYVDASDYPEGYRLVGRYSITGDIVQLSATVKHGTNDIGTIKVTGKRSAIDLLVEEVTDRLEKLLVRKLK
jgi:hypothetical protein